MTPPVRALAASHGTGGDFTGGCTTPMHRRASLPAARREASIATLMLDDLGSASRVHRARERALAIAPRAPGYARAIGAVRHDHRHGGGLLAGALAFRLFGALLQLALFISVMLGYAAGL